MNQTLILLVLCMLAGGFSGVAFSEGSGQPVMSPEFPDEVALQQAHRQVMSKAAVREVVLSDEQSLGVTGEVAALPSLTDNEAVFADVAADQTATDEAIPGSSIGNYKVSGYACNVVNTPDENRIWSIHLYNFESSLSDSEVVFGLSKNRKIQSVACTPDGTFLLFSVQETSVGDYEVYAMDLLTKQVTQLTDNDTDDVDVTLSADGLKMAWQERLADGRQAIAIRTYNESREEFSQVSLASANPFVQPSLSANGQWLALVQMRENNFLGLRYDTEAEEFFEVKRIPRRVRLSHPSVSDDGERYGWLQGKKQTQYIRKNLATDIELKALENAEGIQSPLISPDGDWVIYSYNNTASRSTRLTHLASGQTATLGNESGQPVRYMDSYWMGSAKRPSVVPVTGRLNDTGITQCASVENRGLSCPIADYPGQDAEYGRDFEDNDDSDGHAGFSYTKLDSNGNELLANATDWSCVKDNVNGLIWEVKQAGNAGSGDQGLHDADDLYSWYTSDTSNDGGSPGYQNTVTTCYGYKADDAATYCNTQAYAARVNAQSLCGASDWRLPTRMELRSLLRLDISGLGASINTEYFPNTINSTNWSRYWSATPGFWVGSIAWYVEFYEGLDGQTVKDNRLYIRLVRSGQ